MTNANQERPPGQEPTVVLPNKTSPTHSSGRVRVVLGSGIQLTTQIESLLRTRLRIWVLITLIPSLLFFVLDFFNGRTHEINFLFRCVLLGVVGTLALVLFSRLYLTLARLRVGEVILLIAVAIYFSVLHWEALTSGKPLPGLPAGSGPAFDTLQDAHHKTTNTLRWTILIVLYGTFIPNTWRRCAVIVGALVLWPFVLNLIGTPAAGKPITLAGVAPLQQCVVLSMAATTAIFGSYKIGTLQEEAFEARKVGQYRLVRLLGRGGMGEVYLAEHLLLRRPCALKLIRPEGLGDPKILARFEREVRATAKLTHWNTVEIFDYGHTEDGTFYYVMEYLPGLSLEDLIDTYGPLAPGRAVHLLRQVCQALREAHAVGLLHRDFKPGNILACERGRVYDVAKLLDFGMVKGVGDDMGVRLTQEGFVQGTPAYMSPEQAMGESTLDARSDIYGLGATAYFLVTGQMPFVREKPMQMLMAHIQERVAPPSTVNPAIPADLEAVLLRCLQKDPMQRYQDMEALEEALARCSCASQWDQKMAAAWWAERPFHGE